ncbi:MAG: YraN family protein [Planctomycetaceae bacterium]
MKRWLRKLLGNKGEQYAANFLKGLGYRILDEQVETAFGEIDLIARDKHTIVFVEVKTRRNIRAGIPEEAVTGQKQQHMTKSALSWLKRHRALDQSARFDVISILWEDDRREPEIRHIINAFPPTGTGSMYA